MSNGPQSSSVGHADKVGKNGSGVRDGDKVGEKGSPEGIGNLVEVGEKSACGLDEADIVSGNRW